MGGYAGGYDPSKIGSGGMYGTRIKRSTGRTTTNPYRTLRNTSYRGVGSNHYPNTTTTPFRPQAAPLDEGVGPGASRAEIEEYIRNRYGYFAAFMDIPEVGRVLFDAAVNGWSEGKLQGALYATNWWKNTDAANRTWMQLQSEDPAEARRQVAQTAASIQNRAASFGLNFSAGQISNLAYLATKNGWNDDQRVDYLIGQVNWNTLQGGDLTAMRDDVKAIGSQYLVGVSEQTARNYAMRIASGEMSQDGVASIMRKQAKARFGYLSEEIDQGISVKDYFMPIRDTIARELGLNAEAVDMMDPKWLGMMEARGEDGKVRAATLNEAMLSARKRPEFTGTVKAQEMTTELTTAISRMFGRSGGV
jgi:hypothetical protein